MIGQVRMKRLTAAMLATSALVFGVSVLAGNGRAQSAAPRYVHLLGCRQAVHHDREREPDPALLLVGRAVSHDVAAAVVVKQAKSEAVQVGQTRPQDRTLHATRDLIGSMFLEYSKAVAATRSGMNADKHMTTAWRLGPCGARPARGREGRARRRRAATSRRFSPREPR